MTRASLRARLFVIILVPLLVIAFIVGVWQVRGASDTAEDVFDRSLLTTALAVVADIARSDGDAVSVETRDRLADTSGGPVFYHVYAPDGVFVTGYATPPVPREGRLDPEAETQFFTGSYHGRDVRVLTLKDMATIGGYAGVFTYTVWQDVAVRDAFVRDLTRRTFTVIFALTGTVAALVWFGVNIGLRPLLHLEDAISARSTTDLRPIRKDVPEETRGIVSRLNSLFRQVDETIRAQNEFISNAAHQLRNPIAGVLAMAEAVRSAPTADAAKARADELLDAAHHARDLANKLLTLERIKAAPADLPTATVNLDTLAEDVAADLSRRRPNGRVEIVAEPCEGPAQIVADPVMLREAVTNLCDNALRHGGPDLSRVGVAVSGGDGSVRLEVRDDGRGVAADDIPRILARFGQASPGQGSGLGLSIAEAVAERHGGRLEVVPGDRGLTVALEFPAAGQRPMA